MDDVSLFVFDCVWPPWHDAMFVECMQFAEGVSGLFLPRSGVRCMELGHCTSESITARPFFCARAFA